MTRHILKTINPYFQDVWDLKKLFEVRKNDRNFKVGDDLNLREYDPETNTYPGREIWTEIIYVLDYPPALKKGYVVLGIDVLLKEPF